MKIVWPNLNLTFQFGSGRTHDIHNMKTNECLTISIIENTFFQTNNFEHFSFPQETCVNYAAFTTQSFSIPILKVILLHSQKWVPKIGKQTNIAEPAQRHLGRKFDQKITYVLLTPREKKWRGLPP